MTKKHTCTKCHGTGVVTLALFLSGHDLFCDCNAGKHARMVCDKPKRRQKAGAGR